MPTTTAIDPKASLRGQQITPDKVSTQVTPQQVNYTPVSAVDPVAAQSISGMAGTGPVSYQNAATQRAGGGAAMNTSIRADSVMKNAMNAFQSQLPGMNIDFADQSDQLAKKTAAMGRTGSGLFNRDTGYISDRSRAAREGMLGNLSFTAAQSDAANRLQAQIEQGRLREQEQGRFANTNVANMQSANQLAGINSGNALRAALGNQDTAARIGIADSANALSAAQGNQRTSADIGKFNAGSLLDAEQGNARNDMLSQFENVQNEMRNRDFDSNFLAQERGYQDNLAAQAQQDYMDQMRMFTQGFQGDPGAAYNNAASGISNIGQQYGQNAGQTNAGLQQGIQGILQMLMMGQPPSGMAPPQQAPQFQQPQGMNIDPSLFQQGPQNIGMQPSQPRGFADPDGIFYTGGAR